MQNKKSPGIDSCIVAEILKKEGDFIRAQILQICSNVYQNHQASRITSNLIVPVPKKGNPQLMNNYRGIKLISIAAKVYNKLLLNRVVPTIDKIMRNNQAGFQKERSCIKQKQILMRIMKGAVAKQTPCFIAFIDKKPSTQSREK